jgi:hypothetical protein
MVKQQKISNLASSVVALLSCSALHNKWLSCVEMSKLLMSTNTPLDSSTNTPLDNMINLAAFESPVRKPQKSEALSAECLGKLLLNSRG